MFIRNIAMHKKTREEQCNMYTQNITCMQKTIRAKVFIV